jgi:hypothetical protein
VLVVGEIRRGIEILRRRDPVQTAPLERWFQRLHVVHATRILDVSIQVADLWGRLQVPNPLPEIDGLLAATRDRARSRARDPQRKGRSGNGRSLPEPVRPRVNTAPGDTSCTMLIVAWQLARSDRLLVNIAADGQYRLWGQWRGPRVRGRPQSSRSLAGGRRPMIATAASSV